jgi:catechol 2,3-dioxygenase-like lactoylglutathione lyase family enzyme
MSIGLNAIGIVPKDMERSLFFYRELGINVPPYDPNEDHFGCEAGGVTLMWDTVSLMQQIEPSFEYKRGGNIGIAFECSSPEAVDDAHRRLTSLGFESEKEPWDAFWGQRYAIVKDPDGNSVSLYFTFPG